MKIRNYFKIKTKDYKESIISYANVAIVYIHKGYWYKALKSIKEAT
jgi:hypothetical protein